MQLKKYKYLVHLISRNIIAFLSFRRIKVYWFDERLNLGDGYNRFLVERISRKKLNWVYPKIFPLEHYLLCGSVIENASTKSTIWGAGCLYNETKVPQQCKVLAVRGLKTFEKLSDEQKSQCTGLGDPGILISQLISPKPTTNKVARYGIVLHYADKSRYLPEDFSHLKSFIFIDIETENVEKFVSQINSVDIVISSSLHGLIFADSYLIPSLWLSSNSSRVKGGTYKFEDYFSSIDAENRKAVDVDSLNSTLPFEPKAKLHEIQKSQTSLLNSCPFICSKP